MIKNTFRQNGKDYPKQCRYCKYFRAGEQISTDTYNGITESYDGYCFYDGHVVGRALVLVFSGCTCYGFVPRGD